MHTINLGLWTGLNYIEVVSRLMETGHSDSKVFVKNQTLHLEVGEDVYVTGINDPILIPKKEMKDYGDEAVLCVPVATVAREIGKELETECVIQVWDIEKVLSLWDNGEFYLRNLVEQDEYFKQIIPYCVLRYGDLILNYSRAKTAGEARLGGKRSIGVGGHINPIENGTIVSNILRELEEEVGVTSEDIGGISYVGYVNDEDNDVGRVHFGLVVIVDLNNPDFGEIEPHLVDVRWNTMEEIKQEQELETWSQLLLAELMK